MNVLEREDCPFDPGGSIDQFVATVDCAAIPRALPSALLNG